MSALSSLLVQDQILTVTQIEQALQRQVIFGGDLATNLLELGLIGEDVLAEYLGRVVRQPVLPAGHLENLDSRVIKMLPWQTVYERRVLPVRMQGNTLVIASASPVPADVLAQLSADLEVEIAPHLVLEFRLGMALNRYYGIPLSARLAALQRRLAPDFEPDQQPLAPPPEVASASAGGAASGAAQVGQSRIVNVGERERAAAPAPDGSRLVIESSQPARNEPDTTMRFITGSGKPVAAEPRPRSGEFDPQIEIIQSDQMVDSRGARGGAVQIKFSEATAMVEDARDRDEILDIFLNFAGQAFEFTALFVVQGRLAHGRAALSRWSTPFGIEHLEIPLDQGGMFETVYQTRGFHLGPPSKVGADAAALSRLQRPHPKNCTLLPVLLRQRIILLLYGDSGRRGVRANRVARLADFARTVGAAFEGILLKQKYGQYRKSVPTTPPKARKVEQPTMSITPPERRKVESSASLWSTPSEPREGKVAPTDRARFGVRDDEMIGAETWPEPSKSSIPSPPAEEAPPQAETLPPPTAPAAEPSEAETLPPGPRGEEEPIDPLRDTLPASLSDTQPIWNPGAKPDPGLVQRVEIVTVGAETSPASTPAANKPSPELVARVELHTIPSAAPVERTLPGQLAAVDSKAPTEPPPPAEPSAIAVDDDSSASWREADTPLPEDPELGEGDTLPPHPAADADDPQPALAARAEDPTRSVQVDMTEEIDRLVERVLSRGRFDEEAAELLVGIGDDACSKLIQHFPGPLSYDRYQQTSRLQKVDQHGPLLRVLVMFGDRSVPFLLPLLESLDSEVRFYATFLFTEIHHPDALGSLAQRVFDNDRQIRALALDVLRALDHFPEYHWTMKELAATLVSPSSSLETKRVTAEALGELRTPVAIRGLAEMLGSVDGVLAERCQRALVKITFTDFGFSERRWLNWWSANRDRHRIEWAIDSLNHRTESVRQAAVEELRQMVSGAVKWPSGPLDHKQRRDLKQLCLDWWEREGRALYPVPALD